MNDCSFYWLGKPLSNGIDARGAMIGLSEYRLAVAVVNVAIFLCCAFEVEANATTNDPHWKLLVGAKVAQRPKYIGSGNCDTSVLPVIDGYLALSRNTTLFFADFAMGLDWQPVESASAGLLASGRAGRNSSDDGQLEGMDDIDDTFEVAAYLGWQMHPAFDLNLAVFFDAGNVHQGWLATLTTSWHHEINTDSLSVVSSLALSYGDARFNDTYYGVDARESQINRPVYKVDASVNQAEFSIELQYKPTKHWHFTGGIELIQLYGRVAESPIVERESHLIPAISVAYVF